MTESDKTSFSISIMVSFSSGDAPRRTAICDSKMLTGNKISAIMKSKMSEQMNTVNTPITELRPRIAKSNAMASTRAGTQKGIQNKMRNKRFSLFIILRHAPRISKKQGAVLLNSIMYRLSVSATVERSNCLLRFIVASEV